MTKQLNWTDSILMHITVKFIYASISIASYFYAPAFVSLYPLISYEIYYRTLFVLLHMKSCKQYKT